MHRLGRELDRTVEGVIQHKLPVQAEWHFLVEYLNQHLTDTSSMTGGERRSPIDPSDTSGERSEYLSRVSMPSRVLRASADPLIVEEVNLSVRCRDKTRGSRPHSTDHFIEVLADPAMTEYLAIQANNHRPFHSEGKSV